MNLTISPLALKKTPEIGRVFRGTAGLIDQRTDRPTTPLMTMKYHEMRRALLDAGFQFDRQGKRLP
jgi:hypothetical protein